MATVILRQANVVSSVGGVVKGSPLTNAEVDNNFANVNVAVVDVSNNLTNVNTTLVASIADVSATIIPFAIALG